MEMVCQLPCLSILQTPWGHDLDENSVQASSILKPPWLLALIQCAFDVEGLCTSFHELAVISCIPFMPT